MPVPVKSTDLVYFPVPKIACTSIKTVLASHNENRLAEARHVGKSAVHVHRVYPSVKLRPWHALRYAGRRWFCVVHDPIKRVLSAYGNRVVYHDDLRKCDAALDRAGLPRHPDLGEFAERFEAYSELSRSVRWHTMPQVYFLGRRPERFDRIFAMSQLGELPGYLDAAGAAGLALPHLQNDGPKLSLNDLPAPAAARLRRLYADDYRVFGDWFD